MAKYLEKEGIPLTHIIGPQTPHRYHPDSKIELDRRLDAIAAVGRDPFPRSVKFVTYTLRYNRAKWIVVDGMEKHWEKAQVEATVLNQGSLRIATSNLSALTIDFDPGGAPVELVGNAAIEVDGSLCVVGVLACGVWLPRFVRYDARQFRPATDTLIA